MTTYPTSPSDGGSWMAPLVLAGVDGSAAAAAACGWAARLASATSAELVVASAWQPGQAEGSPEDFAQRRAAVRAQLDESWSTPARAEGITPRTLLVDGSPDVLLQVADTEDADLLVVGSRGAGGFASLHIGSVAHHLAHHTTRPLAIVPQATAQPRVDTIVVGVDGSSNSAAALRWCTGVAAPLGARVVATLAFEPLVEWVPETDPKSWRRLADQQMAEWVTPLRDVGVSVDTVIVEDIHPVAALTGHRGRAWRPGPRRGHPRTGRLHDDATRRSGAAARAPRRSPRGARPPVRRSAGGHSMTSSGPAGGEGRAR